MNYAAFCAARGLDGFERKPGGLRRRMPNFLVGILAHRAWAVAIRERRSP